MADDEEPPHGPARLAYKVVRRRRWLGITAAEAAVAAPLSPTTWSKIETTGTGSRSTYAAVERVLRWRSGSCQAILNGGEPLLAGVESDPRRAAIAHHPDLLRLYDQAINSKHMTDEFRSAAIAGVLAFAADRDAAEQEQHRPA